LANFPDETSATHISSRQAAGRIAMGSARPALANAACVSRMIALECRLSLRMVLLGSRFFDQRGMR